MSFDKYQILGIEKKGDIEYVRFYEQVKNSNKKSKFQVVPTTSSPQKYKINKKLFEKFPEIEKYIGKYIRVKKTKEAKYLYPTQLTFKKTHEGIRQKKTGKPLIRKYTAEHIDEYQVDIKKEQTDGLNVLDLFLLNVEKPLKSLVSTDLNDLQGIKISIDLSVRYWKWKDDETMMRINESFKPKTVELINVGDLANVIDQLFMDIRKRIDEFLKHGSGWKFEQINYFNITITQYKPLKGSSWFDCPEEIKRKKGTINIKNDDNKCFMWVMLSHMFPVEKNKERVSNYEDYVDKIKFPENMTFPVSPCNISLIKQIEKLNNVSISIYGWNFESHHLIPMYVSKYNVDDETKHIDMLYLDNEETGDGHYMLIKSMTRLIYNESKHKEKKLYCRFCLNTFRINHVYKKHIEHCNTETPIAIRYPPLGKNNLHFRSFHKQLKAPFVIYLDFESFLHHIHNDEQSRDDSYTINYQQHVPNSFAYKVVCIDPKYNTNWIRYRGDNCIDTLMDMLFKESDRIFDIKKKIEPMIITEEQEEEFQNATVCHICNKGFEKPKYIDSDEFDEPYEYNTPEKKKVRDHCHITGQYRGAAHSDCNLGYKYSDEIPVIIHNLKGYDSHLIFKGYTFKEGDELEVIPNTMEKYLTFKIQDLRFIDSYQFLASSLASLVKTMKATHHDKRMNDLKKLIKKHKDDNKWIEIYKQQLSELKEEKNRYLFDNNYFPYIKEAFPDYEKYKHIIKKGLYPYDYADNHEKFNLPVPLEKSDWFNKLADESITEHELNKVKQIIKVFDIKTFGEYHDLYLATDVLLLTDVFEQFRKNTITHFQLDPANFWTLPSLAWQAALKKTGIWLELFSDDDVHADMYQFFQIRGGISIITHRHAKANHKYMKNYDKSKPTSYIIYLDANNLYGKAMIQFLPYRGFRWMNDEEIQNLNTNWLLRQKDEQDNGYTLEVDIEYPSEYHDDHNDYPFLPEKRVISDAEVSPHTRKLAKKFNIKPDTTAKLVPTLYHKEKYVCDYRNLKQAVEHGLVIKKIHRVLTYKQKPWLKPFVDFCTEQRKQAKSENEKALFKLFVNSVFGKTMENIMKRQNIKFAYDEKSLQKMMKLPSHQANQHPQYINESLWAVSMNKKEVLLNVPIYVGFTILELSKRHMYEFHYDYIKSKFGNRAKLLFTDTDSLCYHITMTNEATDNDIDFYDVIKDDCDKYFDTSEYPEDHKLYSKKNAKVVGLFKDEAKGRHIIEFIGLRSKMYSEQFDDIDDDGKDYKGRAKGIKEKVSHSIYRKVLDEEKQEYSTLRSIRSQMHQLYTVEMNKVGLSSYDNKRYYRDNVESYAYGHYKISQS